MIQIQNSIFFKYINLVKGECGLGSHLTICPKHNHLYLQSIHNQMCRTHQIDYVNNLNDATHIKDKVGTTTGLKLAFFSITYGHKAFSSHSLKGNSLDYNNVTL